MRLKFGGDGHHMSRPVIASRLISASKVTDSPPSFLLANRAAGTIPVEIGKLTILEDLNLGWTKLAGTIWPSFGVLVALVGVSISMITCPGG